MRNKIILFIFLLLSSSGRLSELATYNDTNVMVRKVVDKYGSGGFKSSRTILDHKDDGLFYRNIVLTFGAFGELVEVAEFAEDGSLIKRDTAPFKQLSHSDTILQAPQDEDRILSSGRSRGEYLEPDAHGNWTRQVGPSTILGYASGKKIKTEVLVYRELTYYQ